MTTPIEVSRFDSRFSSIRFEVLTIAVSDLMTDGIARTFGQIETHLNLTRADWHELLDLLDAMVGEGFLDRFTHPVMSPVYRLA